MDTTLIYMQNKTIERYNMKTNTDNKTEERKNRFSGESIMLTKEESIIHDRIFINDIKAKVPGDNNQRDIGNLSYTLR